MYSARLNAQTATRTGSAVLNSSFLVLKIATQEIGTSTGHRIVVMMNITKDKNLSSGEELG